MPLVKALRYFQRVGGAEPNRLLASRCKLVKSYNNGESCVVGLLSSVTVPGLWRHLSRMLSARLASTNVPA